MLLFFSVPDALCTSTGSFFWDGLSFSFYPFVGGGFCACLHAFVCVCERALDRYGTGFCLLFLLVVVSSSGWSCVSNATQCK